MGVAPESYYEFVVRYASWFYVVPPALAADVPSHSWSIQLAGESELYRL